MKIGSLVELVDDKWSYNVYDDVRPVKNIIYVVREFEDANGDIGIRLEEIINPIRNWGIYGIMECYFILYHFRELQPPMDISELIKESIKEPA